MSVKKMIYISELISKFQNGLQGFSFGFNNILNYAIGSFVFFFIITSFQLSAQEAEPKSDFLKNHPNLEEYIYKEPHSNFYFGVGFSPLGLMKNRIFFSGSIFQLHYISDWLDHEIINISI